MTRQTKKWLGNWRILFLLSAMAVLLAGVWLSYFIGKEAPPLLSETGRTPRTSHDLPMLAQGGPETKPAAGRFLIAGRDLRDPNFFQTVILLIEYKPEGALGLIINRPTGVKLSALLPQVGELEKLNSAVYIGGPVQRDAVLLLVRSDDEPENSERVFGNVFVSTSQDLLERLVADTEGRRTFRAYSGYAGWAPRQLDAEMARGGWSVLRADAKTVFDPAPLEVWERLIRRTEVRFAVGGGPVAPAPRGQTVHLKKSAGMHLALKPRT